MNEILPKLVQSLGLNGTKWELIRKVVRLRFMHDEDDMASFKMITSQLYINGAAKQVEIVNAFSINPLSLKRWVKKYREEGPAAFYVRKPRGRKTLKKSPDHDEDKTAGD